MVHFTLKLKTKNVLQIISRERRVQGVVKGGDEVPKLGGHIDGNQESSFLCIVRFSLKMKKHNMAPTCPVGRKEVVSWNSGNMRLLILKTTSHILVPANIVEKCHFS